MFLQPVVLVYGLVVAGIELKPATRCVIKPRNTLNWFNNIESIIFGAYLLFSIIIYMTCLGIFRMFGLKEYLMTCGLFHNFDIYKGDNVGFGMGHHACILQGNNELIISTNVDLEYPEHSLVNAIQVAMCDHEDIAAWEFRQKPYESPKYYDPVTFETTWNSHACVLFKRDAYIKVGGYDKDLFMYGEDVEMSFRLRKYGYRLRYLPNAFVFHYTYSSPDETKKLQFLGNCFANGLLRFKYGTQSQIKKWRWISLPCKGMMAVGRFGISGPGLVGKAAMLIAAVVAKCAAIPTQLASFRSR